MDRADMIYDLSTIWASVKEVFPYFDRLTFDWDELYRSYLVKVLSVRDEEEFHRLLSSFVESLNDGHTKYIPPEAFRKAEPFVSPDAPSFTLRENILTIQLNDFLSDHAPLVKDLLESNPDVSLVVLDIRDNIGGNTFYAANVAQLFLSGVFHGCRKWTQTRRAIDVASASQLVGFSEEQLQRYIKDGLLTQEEVADAEQEMLHTKYETYTDTYGSEDHTAVYEGPLQILISRKTVSAAEDFTAMFKTSHRAVLVGEPTFGSTGTHCIIRLRCGGRAQIVSVGYRLLDGTDFIGKGIMPDLFSGGN